MVRPVILASLLCAAVCELGSHLLFAQASDVVALRAARLTRAERQEIARAVMPDPVNVDPNGPSDYQIALGSWLSFVRLSDHPGTVVQVSGGPDNPLNGATGNTAVWLFQLGGGHARLILSGGGSGYGPASKAFHHGMRDYQTFWNMSCCDGSVEVYRFDGVRYKPLYCFEQTIDEEGHSKDSAHGKCNDQ